MKAIFKSKLVREFDRAINDARDSDCEILCFKLESEEENTMMHSWLLLQQGFTPTIGETYDYEGIVVHFYEGD